MGFFGSIVRFLAAGLNKRDTTEHLLKGALLRPIVDGGPIRLRRYPPDASLARYVRHYWFVSWDLPEAQSYVQPVLTMPAVNAVVEADGAWVYGVRSRRDERILTGRGNAWGVLFLPTGFYPFWQRSLHLLQNRRIPFWDAFESRQPPRAPRAAASCVELSRALAPGLPDSDARACLDGYLSTWVPESHEHDDVQAWVKSIETDSAITRVEQLAERHQVNVRTLQRLMRTHVGLGPKQVIRRYRLLEAAARLASGEILSHAHLALDLGYADQAHFVRDFRAVTGNSPGRQQRSRGA